MNSTSAKEVRGAVRERDSQGVTARGPEPGCPVDSDARFLAVLPQEILERAYGCGRGC